MNLLSALVALGILIFVHELGHFLVAKRAGVKVNVFSLGFGPKLLGARWGETEYRLSAVPLGGYVRMVGESPGEEVDPAELGRSFAAKPLAWRVAIVAAGPIANLLLALAVYYGVLLAWGIPSLTTLVGEVLPERPAALAGIQKGDRVLAVNDQPVEEWGAMVAAIQQHGDRPLEIVVDREGQWRKLTLTPQRETATDLFGESREVFRVGIVASQETRISELSAGEALPWAVRKTYLAGEIIFISVLKIIERKVSVDNLGGPILIAQAASEAARHGLAPFLDLLALISVNLAVLNLLPIPALDGGHLFFFLCEAIRRKPLSERARDRAQQVGMAVLLLLMTFLFYNDIARIVTGGQF